MTKRLEVKTMSTDTTAPAVSKPADTPHVSLSHTGEKRNWTSIIVSTAYIIFLMIPIYWLIIVSMKDNLEIMTSFSVVPQNWTLKNYINIFTDEAWYSGYINSAIYVVMNTAISIILATASLATSMPSSGSSPTACRRQRCSRCPSSSSTQPSA
jgi:glycerol transport system permease protein